MKEGAPVKKRKEREMETLIGFGVLFLMSCMISLCQLVNRASKIIEIMEGKRATHR